MWFNHRQKYDMFMGVDKLEDLQKGYKYKKTNDSNTQSEQVLARFRNITPVTDEDHTLESDQPEILICKYKITMYKYCIPETEEKRCFSTSAVRILLLMYCDTNGYLVLKTKI